ncbi:MAG: cyanophycin synthetase [Planctomycetota bacterium]
MSSRASRASCAACNFDGLLVLGADVPAAVEHAARCAVWRLGREVQLDVRSMERGRARFDVVGPGFAVRDVRLAVPGRFNAGNAALAAALALGVVPFHRRASAAQDVAHALGEFRGVARRFETWGTFGDVELVHDYAHHPTELAATFDAARGAFEGRELCVLFQPHQHSRTSHFIGEFAKELAKADRVVVTEVYGARAHIDGEHFAGSEDLVRLVRALGVEAEFVPELGEATRRFAEILPERAAALVLGAGDVENVRDDLSGLLSVRTQAASAAR